MEPPSHEEAGNEMRTQETFGAAAPGRRVLYSASVGPMPHRVRRSDAILAPRFSAVKPKTCHTVFVVT